MKSLGHEKDGIILEQLPIIGNKYFTRSFKAVFLKGYYQTQ
jgi:hypothetical protein